MLGCIKLRKPNKNPSLPSLEPFFFFFFFFLGSKILHKLYLIIFIYFFIPSALAKYNAASIAPNFSQASVEDLFHRLVRY